MKFEKQGSPPEQVTGLIGMKKVIQDGYVQEVPVLMTSSLMSMSIKQMQQMAAQEGVTPLTPEQIDIFMRLSELRHITPRPDDIITTGEVQSE